VGKWCAESCLRQIPHWEAGTSPNGAAAATSSRPALSCADHPSCAGPLRLAFQAPPVPSDKTSPPGVWWGSSKGSSLCRESPGSALQTGLSPAIPAQELHPRVASDLPTAERLMGPRTGSYGRTGRFDIRDAGYQGCGITACWPACAALKGGFLRLWDRRHRRGTGSISRVRAPRRGPRSRS